MSLDGLRTTAGVEASTSGVTLRRASTGPGPFEETTDAALALALQPAFVRLAADYTLTSQTGAQQLFNVPAGGALTLAANSLYFFESLLLLTTMSATSGNALIDLLGAGTATLASQLWSVVGLDATTQTTAAALSGSAFTAAAAADVVVAATGTGLHLHLRGSLTTSTGGTLIPSIGLTTAAAAVVKAGSYFRIYRAGASDATSFGAWA
jgi:hypothetical protein